MKKKSLIALILAFVMVFGTAQAVFAGYPGIDSASVINNEVDAETVAMTLVSETQAGGYKLVSTEKLKSWIDDSSKKMVVLDTMPADWYAKRHIPGAINFYAPLAKDLATEPLDEKGLLKAVQDEIKAKYGMKEVKYYWNSKSKKWTTKKPAKKYWKKCTKKKDKYYGKKTKIVKKHIMNIPIVCYCGFVKCTRSDVAASFLVKKGYTKVYRQPGGISAWYDAEYPIDGTNPQPD